MVVGVSGGPDSLCLLDLLHSLREAPPWGGGDLTLSIHVAHLNHDLRPEAASEAEFVRAEAEKRGLLFHIETADTRAHARAHKQSIEEAARELRYAFLRRLASTTDAPVIAVAHTADDQAETVLMHFLRGAGVGGLRGMLPKTEIKDWRLETGISTLQSPVSLIRPLLAVSRFEIEAYCAEHDLHPVQDATNLDTTFFRNRLRHELLPQLETYNPNIRAVLRRMAEVMAGDHAMLRGVVQALWESIARLEQGRVTFDKARWLALTAPEQCALLREAVTRLRPDRHNVDFTPLERAVRFSCTAQPGRSCDVLGGLRLSISRTHVIVSAWANADAPTPDDLPLIVAGGQIPSGWQFCVETLKPGEWSLDEVESDSSGWRVFVDARTLQAPPRVRTRLPGDRFQPLGMNGHSLKVSDFMINAKMEAVLRGCWPIVVSGDEIVWLAGLRLDERFKVAAATERVMRLSFAKKN